jgi:hypothetical protein
MLNVFVDDDFGLDVEIGIFARNMKTKVIGFIDFFLSFLIRYDEKRIHNMLTRMLDHIFKRLRLISFFIGGELGIAIATKYDKKLLFLMF